MAFGERWSATFNPLGQAVTYKVIIKEDGYVGGSSPISNYNDSPLLYRNRGIDIFSIGSIIGTEVEFSFWIEPSDSTFDDLFTATDRQFLIEVERDSVSDFIGYMKFENLTKPLIDVGFMVTISATDGLSYLKEVEFKDSTGALYTDIVTIIEQVKRALTLTGHTLDIKVKLGTWETSEMISTEGALKETKVDSTRFLSTQKGVLRADTCADVLSNLLGMFNCSMMQIEATWYIFNNNEIDSYLFTYDWATLTQQSRVVHNPSLDIESYSFESIGDVSYRPPINKVEVTFQNKFIPTTLISNGDFSSGTTDWTNGSAPNNMNTFSVVSEELNCLVGTLQNDDRWFTSASFTVAKIADTDKLIFALRAKASLADEEEELPFLSVLITGPEGSETIPLGKMSNDWKVHEPTTPPDILGDGSYTVRIIVEAESFALSPLTMFFDDISLYVDYGGAAVTVDSVHSIQNDNIIEGVIEEVTIRTGDSQYTNDKGATTIGGTLTSAWNTFGNTEAKELIELLGAKQLELRQSYNEYMRLQINDPNDNVKRNSILGFNSKNYKIIRFNKNFIHNSVDVDLLEIDSGTVTYTRTKENSTNVDGESEASASQNVVAVWGNITGTLANQLDLDSALDSKEDTIPANTYEPYDLAIVKSDEAETISATWGFDEGVDFGSTSKITDTEIRSLSGDTKTAKISAYGLNQGSGIIYAGQSSTHGGGIAYYGDATPSPPSGFIVDRISFFKRSGGTDVLVFSYAHDDTDVTFVSTVAATSFIEGGTALSATYEPLIPANTYEPYDLAIVKSDEAEVITAGWDFQGAIPIEFTGETNGHQHIKFITSGGNYTLGVASSTGIGLFSGASNFSMQIGTESARDFHIGTNDAVRVTVDGTTGAITATSTITATNFIDSASDKRLKKNIKEISKSDVDNFDNINTLSFEYKEAVHDVNKNKQFGVIAQEIKDLYPSLVYSADDYYGVNYQSLAVLTLKKVQEQQKEIKEIKELLKLSIWEMIKIKIKKWFK